MEAALRCPTVDYSKLIGVPFKWGGRDLSGLDCWGIVRAYHALRGVTIPDPLEYQWDPREGKDAAADVFGPNITAEWLEVAGAAEPGDVLLLSRNGGECAVHCAVYVGGQRILHATSQFGVVSEPLRRVRGRLLKAYRYAGA